MPTILDRIYSNSNLWFQNIGLSLYGYVLRNRRFGGNFKNQLVEFAEREGFSESKWKTYQTHQLRKLLVLATERVPYYRQAYPNLDRNSLTNFNLENLSELPLLEKENLRSNPDAFIADYSTRRKLYSFYTSGTTGTPLLIKATLDMHRLWSAAYEARVRRWAGLNYTMSRAMIGGRLVVPKAKAKPPFWRYNLAERQLYMSAFHISPRNAGSYVEAINHYQPDYLVGYASSHFSLARIIDERSSNS